MQPTRARASRGNQGRLVRRLSAIMLVPAVTVVAACHDAPTSVLAPMPPTLAVGTDGVWFVNSLADPGDGSCTNSECTLREAIAAAQNGERVTFKSNLSGTIALSAGELVVDKSLTIEARDASQITVDGQGVSKVLAISSDVLVNLSGLTITGGKGNDGGGIKVSGLSTLNVFGSVITGNDGGSSGGGIHASHATVRVIGSTIAGNTALSGGGIFVEDDNLTVVRSTISGNTSDRGGGIFHVCGGSAACNTYGVSLRSSTITRNEAEITGGGVMSNTFASIIIANTIIAGNGPFGSAFFSDEADCNFVVSPESLGYNLTSPDTGCPLTSPTDIILQSISQVFTAVLFPVLAENGSPRPTHALIERGFAVDAGYCPGEAGDQRGFPRPYDDLRMPNALDGCDIGAFEWQPADTKIKGPKP